MRVNAFIRTRACSMDYPGGRAAFTLVELLVVMTVMLALMTLATVGFRSLSSAQALTRGGELVGSQIAQARQQAVTSNRPVEVRFIDPGDSQNPGFRIVQIWRLPSGETVMRPAERLVTLPIGVRALDSLALSPMLHLDGSPVSGEIEEGPHAGRPFRGLRFRGNGEPETSLTNQNNWLTLTTTDYADSPSPTNFFALQVNPVTGRVTTYRP